MSDQINQESIAENPEAAIARGIDALYQDEPEPTGPDGKLSDKTVEIVQYLRDIDKWYYENYTVADAGNAGQDKKKIVGLLKLIVELTYGLNITPTEDRSTYRELGNLLDKYSKSRKSVVAPSGWGESAEKKLTEKEKLYEILKLENQDIGDKIDISKDWGDLAEVMRLVTEIARFAISDLATEKDQENRYIKVNEEDTYGNKKFHTLSFRNWVRDKSMALLTTYGFKKEIIERALIIVLKDEKRRKNSIYDDDWIRGMNIYDLGELIHISDGNHTPTLTRLLRLKKGEDIFMIISSLPTHELRIKDNEIKLIGCMRFTKNNSLTELLPIQEIDTYSQPPLLLEDILEETDRDKQKQLAKSLLIDRGVPQKLEDIWDRDDGDTLESLDAKKLEDNYPPFNPIGLDHYDPKKIKVRRNFMPIIVKNGYDTYWYIISKRGDESFAEAAYYKLPSGVYWRYICRIFGERPKMRFKRIGGKKVILRTKIPLPSRGYRIMSTTQAVSKKVRRNMNFDLIEKNQKGAYTKIEWIVDEIVWDTYVRNYLEKYCLYEMEEVK